MIYKLFNLKILLLFAMEVRSAKKEHKPLLFLDGRFAGNSLPRSPASQAFGSS